MPEDYFLQNMFDKHRVYGPWRMAIHLIIFDPNDMKVLHIMSSVFVALICLKSSIWRLHESLYQPTLGYSAVAADVWPRGPGQDVVHLHQSLDGAVRAHHSHHRGWARGGDFPLLRQLSNQNG